MLISGGILIQGGILFFNDSLPNIYVSNYTFLSGQTYEQSGTIGIEPNVALTFQNNTTYILLPT